MFERTDDGLYIVAFEGEWEERLVATDEDRVEIEEEEKAKLGVGVVVDCFVDCVNCVDCGMAGVAVALVVVVVVVVSFVLSKLELRPKDEEVFLIMLAIPFPTDLFAPATVAVVGRVTASPLVLLGGIGGGPELFFAAEGMGGGGGGFFLISSRVT